MESNRKGCLSSGRHLLFACYCAHWLPSFCCGCKCLAFAAIARQCYVQCRVFVMQKLMYGFGGPGVARGSLAHC
jgi:hypothetical protein